MTWIVAGATVLGAGANYLGSQNATNAQERAGNKAIDLQREQFNKSIELQEPFRQAGITGQNRLMQLLGLGDNTGTSDYGRYGRDFNMSDFQEDPGYAFRIKEGVKALDRTAAGRQGLISGSAIKAAQRYGQEMGSQEYQNAFNRYQVNRSNQLNPLQSLAGQGQTSANVMGQAGQNYAQGAGDIYQGIGNARASAYIGGANAINRGLSQYLNYQQGQNLLNKAFPSPGAA